MLTALPTLDALLAAHAGSLGEDATGYRHHAYRVANFYWLLAPGDADALEKLSIAVAFHDLGIWTAGTFDYLPPSRILARDYLHQTGKAAWMVEIDAMIECHHKFMRTPAGTSPAVEAFRRADWIDVSLGMRRFGLSRRAVRDVMAAFPDAGFHRRLAEPTLTRLRHHPLDPLPMVRW